MIKRIMLATCFAMPAFAMKAEAASNAEVQALQNELRAMKSNYETHIQKLESRLNELENRAQTVQIQSQPVTAPPGNVAQTSDNAFNPAIGAVLNGRYNSFSGHNPAIAGFQAGEEGGRPNEGLGVDESELNFSANIDNIFAASLTTALSEDKGETEIELEEAYIRTLGLPEGLGVKAGRFFAPVGYLNEHHTHTDDFGDRPLPNRVFLNNAYKDDGVQVSWILPTSLYTEIGGAALRGGDFPGSNANGNDAGAWLGYVKFGGDIGANHNWLLGFTALHNHPDQRADSNGTLLFDGNSNLYTASLRYVWTPTGNRRNQEVSFQGEYFWRNEDGTYEDTDAATGAVAFDDHQGGWYVQMVYKFAPQWRIGTRYSQLISANVPAALSGSALDARGRDPWNAALMADWTHSEFSRVRLQYNHEEPSSGQTDDQVMLQYIMSIGAHPAHIF